MKPSFYSLSITLASILWLSACGGASSGTGSTSTPTGSSSSSSSSGTSSSSSSTSSSSSGSVKLVVAINAGSDSSVIYENIEFEGDKYYSGGDKNPTTDPIAGTTDDALFQTEHYGVYSYAVPVTNDTYRVELYMAEIYWTEAGKRSFNVIIEGKKALSELDLYAQAGHDGAYNYTVNSILITDGSLDIELQSLIDQGTLSGFAVYSANGKLDVSEPPEPPVNSGPKLGKPGNFGIAAGHLKFLGNIWNSKDVNSKQRQDAYTKIWNQVTLENSGKWEITEPKRDQMNLDAISTAYNWAKAHGGMYRHHVLVWGSQQPKWMDGLSKTEQAEEVEEHIREICTRFPNIDMIDVVNEPLHAKPKYRDALGGDGATGWDWVIWSFRKAREHCPNSVLGLNDYNILHDTSAINKYMKIVNLLKDRKLIDSVGIQLHDYVANKVNANSARKNLDKLAAAGLPVMIEEFDVKDSAGAKKYKELFPAIWEHPAVAGFTIWGQRKNETWLPKNRMGVLNPDGSDSAEMKVLRDYFNNN